MNLPNAITFGRIAITPLVALLPFIPDWPARLAAFVVFLVAAISDYFDGKFARSRNLITNLGKILDPLADKLLLIGTFVPMFLLVGSQRSLALASPHDAIRAGGSAFIPALGVMRGGDLPEVFPFLTPFGLAGLPWWILAVVLGRELFMTVFRQAAVRRGVYIAAIGPAKWKVGFQWTWVGATYFWFFAATLIAQREWSAGVWRGWGYFNAFVVIVSMVGAFVLTLYSWGLYLHQYGPLVFGRAPRASTTP